jgi:hypothetical protein
MSHFPSHLIDRRCLALVALAGALSALSGCGGKVTERVAVAGEVTFDGQPLQEGQVDFEPRGPGRMAIGQVSNGRYTIAAERGPSAGDYLVRITATRPTGAMASTGSKPGDELREVYEQFLPAKYNDASELSLKIDATSAIEKDFELHSG